MKIISNFNDYCDMFVSGILGQPQPNTDDISDENLRDAKGFDTMSFKKPKETDVNKEIKVGDCVRVVSDCKTKGLWGTVTHISSSNGPPQTLVTVEFDMSQSLGLRTNKATYSASSLEIINTKDTKSGEKQSKVEAVKIALFTEMVVEKSDIEEGKFHVEADLYVILQAKTVDEAIRKVNGYGGEDLGNLRSLVFDNKLYQLEPVKGVQISKEEAL